MSLEIAYIAEGKLYLKRGEIAPQLIESPFVQQMLDRTARARQRQDWKNEGMAWRLGAGGFAVPRRMEMPNVRRARISGLSRGGQTGQLLYSLEADGVGGLFSMDLADNHERRIYHRNQFHAQDLARHRSSGALAVSTRDGDGAAHIAVMDAEGRGLREVTEGDAVDEAPAWVEGEGKKLVFQSAGVGRDPAGVRVALGTYAIMMLDLDSGDFKTLLEEDDHDLLLPYLANDGTLLFIRRPYEPHGPTVSPWRVASDILFFPIRLIVAIVHFFNWFSQVFARKPLITAGGPPREGPQERYMMLWGKIIDAEKAMRAANGDKSRSLVPDSWQLTRRLPDGRETVLARGVLAFDVANGGEIVFTNGSAVYLLGPDGKATELCRGRMIEAVRLAGENLD